MTLTTRMLGLMLPLVLTACSSESTPEAAPAVSAPAASTAVSPAQAPLPTIEEAGAVYLNIVSAFNEKVDAFALAVESPAESALSPQAAASDLADANRVFSAALLDAAWPTEIQPTVDDLIAACSAAQSDLRAMGSADDAEFTSAFDAAAASFGQSGQLAELLRLKLRLPEREQVG